MKKIIALIAAVLFMIPLFAQDDEDDQPVRAPFESSILIDNQTVISPMKGSFEFRIHHRFGTMKNGVKDIFGIYAPSNIRLGFNYGLTDKIMLGIGTTKDYKLQDLQWKYSILQQTRSGSIPVSVSYYGNMVIDARPSENFGPEDKFEEIHRLSYLTQLLIAHKFNFKYTLQVAPSFAYFNSVEDGRKNGNFGISASGRARILGATALIFEYDQLLTKQEGYEPKPNLAAGVEFGTATHAFEVFVANYSQIIYQRNLVYNTNDFMEGDFLLGFNITVRF